MLFKRAQACVLMPSSPASGFLLLSDLTHLRLPQMFLVEMCHVFHLCYNQKKKMLCLEHYKMFFSTTTEGDNVPAQTLSSFCLKDLSRTVKHVLAFNYSDWFNCFSPSGLGNPRTDGTCPACKHKASLLAFQTPAGQHDHALQHTLLGHTVDLIRAHKTCTNTYLTAVFHSNSCRLCIPVLLGKLGMSLYLKTCGSLSISASPPMPEPHTIPTVGRTCVLDRSQSAVVWHSS